ncbi:MAG: hypothetical protein U1E08_02830 [Coriobacteriia bacterium]|nr:hypothetical protein [Coriobacteriia bacterium]
MPRTVQALTIVFVLALGLSACAATESAKPADVTPEPAATVEPEEEPDFSYLTGTWSVTTDLTGIDNAAMTPAADQPGATWECIVSGDTMVLLTDRHEYSGTLRPEADSGWSYEASATFTDEDGHTWTSTIMVSAKPTGLDFSTFAGGMTGSIDSDIDGHLYTATWDIVGTRQ